MPSGLENRTGPSFALLEQPPSGLATGKNPAGSSLGASTRMNLGFPSPKAAGHSLAGRQFNSFNLIHKDKAWLFQIGLPAHSAGNLRIDALSS